MPTPHAIKKTYLVKFKKITEILIKLFMRNKKTFFGLEIILAATFTSNFVTILRFIYVKSKMRKIFEFSCEDHVWGFGKLNHDFWKVQYY